MAVLGGYIGGGSAQTGDGLDELGDLGQSKTGGGSAGSLLTSVTTGVNLIDAFRSGSSATRPSSWRSASGGGTAVAVPGGGFNPQVIQQAEDQLRQQGMKTCFGLLKDASGNVVGVSPRQIKVTDPCPAGAMEAADYIASRGGAAPPTQQYAPPAQQYAPPAQQYGPPPEQYAVPRGEGMMTGDTPAAPVPWYKKWWVWALIVGGTATVGVGGYLIYRRHRATKATAELDRWSAGSEW